MDQEPTPLFPEDKPNPIEAAVEAWFIETFHNHGPQLSTELFNHFVVAKGKLKKLLADITKE